MAGSKDIAGHDEIDSVEKEFTSSKVGSDVAACPSEEKSVGQPGFFEGLIPIWGSGRSAVDDFQNGRWGWGLVNVAFAVTDVFLIKALATGIIKGVGKKIVTETGEAVTREGAESLSKKRAIQLAKNKAQGKLYEENLKKQLVKEGHEIVGEQVSIKTKHTRRVVDILIRDKNTGKLTAIEAKSGNAVRNAKQVLKDSSMAIDGGKIIGKNAQPELLGQTFKIPTKVR